MKCINPTRSRNLLCTLLFLLPTVFGFSQQLISEIEDLNWNIISSKSVTRHLHTNNSNSFRSSLAGFAASTIRIGDNEAAAIVAVGGKDYAVMKFDDKMRTKWQTALPGEPHLLFRFFEDLLVFVGIGKRNQDYQLFFLDPATGKIKKQTKYYELEKFGATSRETNFYPLYNKTTGEYKLCIRHFDKKEKELTLGINMITFDKDYNIVTNDVIPALNSGYFIDCGLNNNGDFVLLSMSPSGHLTTQLFEAKTWIPGVKVPLSLEIKEKSQYRAGLRFSENSADNVFVFAEYMNNNKEEISTVYKINTKTGSHASHQLELGKKAIKTLSANLKPTQKSRKPNFDNWNNMHFTKILESGDRLVIFREVTYNYAPQSGTYFVTGDGLVNIVDKDMKPIADIVVPKKFLIPAVVGMNSSLHIQGNNLLIISGSGSGNNRDALLTSIDIPKGKMNKMELLQKDGIRSRFPCEPRATIWFKNGFAVPYLDPDTKMMVIYRIQTNLQLYNYK